MTRKISLLILISLCLASFMPAQDLTGVRIYINPGHGGYDSDDRNVVIPPFTSHDPNGFWESKSNLDKGLMLKTLLDDAGATTRISRVTNTTADDLPLSQIVASANSFNADFMLSIHSNAGGATNHVLMLYAGIDPGDTGYTGTIPPRMAESRAISEVIAKNLYANEITTWAYPYSLRGDKTAARQWFGWSNGYGVLRGLTVPGVISEGAMHDYIPETYRLMNMEYKYLEAWNFFKSFAAYFKTAEIPHGLIAGAVRDRFLPATGQYVKIPNSKDQFLPLNGAVVKLLETGETYTTDNLNNGIFVFKNLSPGNYTLQVECTGYHAQNYPVTVTQNKISFVDTRLNRIRNTPPVVEAYSPNVAPGAEVSVTSKITIRFNWDIDPESAKNAFSISPQVEGSFEFKEQNYVMEFTPTEAMAKATLYTVTLDKSLKHFDEISMTDDFSFSFTTKNRNKIELLGAYPAVEQGKVHFEQPRLFFVFDRRLRTAGIESKVKIYDSAGKEINRASFSTTNNDFGVSYGSTAFKLGHNLTPGEKYMAKIIKGIKDVDDVLLPDTIIIPFTAVDERHTTYPTVLDFESNALLTAEQADGIGLASVSVARNSTMKLFGNYSYNLKYTFTGSEAGEAIYKFPLPPVTVTNDSTLGMHIHGDFSGNELYLMFAADGDLKEVKLDSIHYGGWRYAEASLNKLQPHVEYRLTGYKVVQRQSPLSKIGNLFIDNMTVHTTVSSALPPATGIDDDIVIYPNPASDYLHVQTPHTPWLQLYTLNGLLLKAAYDHRLGVSDLPAGTYLLKVKTNHRVYNRMVMIGQ